MKSPVAGHAGRHNLKGKKFSFMTCRCCYIFNFKDKLKKIEDNKKMREAKQGFYSD